MSDRKWYIGLAFVVGSFLTAHAATNPDPFNIKRQNVQAAQETPAPVTPAPPVINVAPAPVTVAPAPANPQFDILMWIWTGLAAIFTAIQGKAAFRPAAPGAPGAPVIPSGVTTVLNKLNDPNTIAGLEAMGLRVVQSGVPGQLIQSGASMIPGVGPIAAQLEPMLRSIVTDALKRAQEAPHA